MTDTFADYELMAQSGLFDAAYYLRANPDVADENIDPLMHYIERGCLERRNPCAHFDTSHYLRQCKAIGERPTNALLHFLTIGVDRGLTPSPAGGSRRRRSAMPVSSVAMSSAQGSAEVFGQRRRQPAESVLSVDIPRIVSGAADAPVRGGLSIVGWCVAVEGIAKIDIALDGTRVAGARWGLRRPDVAAAHPDWEDSLLSGFAAHLPPKMLPVGHHRVTVSLHDGKQHITSAEFKIDVQEAAADHAPWGLRRKMSQAEVDLKLELLERRNWRPSFRVLLPLSERDKAFALARRSLVTLMRQSYSKWELCLVPVDTRSRLRVQRGHCPPELIDGLEDIAHQIAVLRTGVGASSTKVASAPKASDVRSLVVSLSPGDELGCDALIEFALASASDRDADFLYCDDRRVSPADGRRQPFFKPAWSPDLLLSTNYIGRAWCADARLITRAGLTLAELPTLGAYEVALRLTEAAKRIHHIPIVLYERGDSPPDTAAQERQTLAAALQRRQIDGEVKNGCLKGSYRVQRAFEPALVSIIIPTCASNGLIETCLNTLRARTTYRKYEIICIENIPEAGHTHQLWLRTQVDTLIHAGEQFNWSRFNNRAAARANGKYLLFLNDDIEIIDPSWLDALLEQGQRPEVGVVGARLLYPDRSVQHAGVMLDHSGRGLHAFRHLAESDPGYFGLALTQRNVISVTGACLLTRRDTFEALGRFEEAHAVVNNDLDYCLRAWQRGLLNVYTPHARLIHHELSSRGQLEDRHDVEKFDRQWNSVIAQGDPYFNRNLSRDHEPFTVEQEPFEAVYAGHPQFARSSIRRILVVKLDHIGDCITALPALSRLKHHFPAARISVLAGRATHSIWKAQPVVDEVIEFNLFHARSGLGKLDVSERARKALEQSLRAYRFDLAIDLRKQPDTRELLQITGAPILAGFDHAGRFPWLDVALEWDEDVPLRSKHGHVADDLVSLIDALATRSDPDRSAFIQPLKERLSLAAPEQRRLFSRPLICVHPAAGSAMRQWPLEKFSALIDLLLQRDNYNIALVGGADEQEMAARVLAPLARRDQVFNLVGRLGLAELPTLLARAALFVGNNSGPQHLAAGLGVATIGVHSGVVDAVEWGPLGQRALAVRRAMSCSPCFLEHPKDCQRGLACLSKLEVGDVYNACARMLADAGPRVSNA